MQTKEYIIHRNVHEKTNLRVIRKLNRVPIPQQRSFGDYLEGFSQIRCSYIVVFFSLSPFPFSAKTGFGEKGKWGY